MVFAVLWPKDPQGRTFMSCGSLRARLLTAALIGATVMPILAQSGGQDPAQRPATPPAGQPAEPPRGTPAAAPQTPPAPGAPAGAQPAEPAQPAFRTGINFVRVDALVTDNKGNAVENLTQDDFEVFEDNKPQKVESFRFIKVEGNPLEGELPRQIRTTWDEETELARDDVRLFVIFYDDYHVRRGSALAVKRQLTEFIRKNVGPMDILGVMYPLTPFSTIGYTRNHEAVIKEIEAWDGRRFDYRPRNEFEERYAYYPTEIVERIRNQVSLSALEALVTGLGTKREGRKSVILISEGYSNYLPPQLRDPSAALPGVGNPNRNRPLVGERTPDERNAEQRAQFFSYTDLLSDLREVFTAANRANCAIYALDPRGLAAFEFDIDQGVGQQMDKAALDAGLDTLRTLADETDGRAILNSNDLVKGLRQMVKDASSYYLLGYTASSPTDGKFKQIRVKVKRPGLQVRARKGYWALSVDDVAAVTAAATRVGPAPEIGQALAQIETPVRARTIRTWIGTSRGENGRTAVTLVWEPAPVASGERREPAAQVAVTAGGQSGAAYFRGKVPSAAGPAATGPAATGTAPAGTAPAGTGPTGPTRPAAAGATADAGSGGRVTFQAPPGPLQLRLSVEGAAGQVLDSDFRDVVVPDYAKPEPMLSVPAIFRARTQRDVNLLNAAADPRPSTAREFSRTERLHVRFQAYAPGGGVAAPTARLLNRTGSQMADVPVRAAAARGPADFEADVPLASLPAGDYLIEVAMPGEQAPAKQLVAFRVTS
jgi:VWFA-related protein